MKELLTPAMSVVPVHEFIARKIITLSGNSNRVREGTNGRALLQALLKLNL
jgi:hypothetical protein